MGKIGVAVSPADAGRVWAIVEAEGCTGLTSPRRELAPG